MGNVDTRQEDRDSLFLLANLRVEGEHAVHRVKVRNLSNGGMMADGDVVVERGALVHVELRNLGWVEGNVAWKQDNRFGIAFVEEIDPKIARSQVKTSDGITPRYAKSFYEAQDSNQGPLRKL